MDRNSSQGRLIGYAQQISALELDKLLRPPKAGGLSFTEDRSLFEGIIAFYSKLATSALDFLPPGMFEDSLAATNDLVAVLQGIMQFDVTQSDPNRELMGLRTRLARSWNLAYTRIALPLLTSQLTSGSIDREMRSVQSVAENLRSGFDTQMTQWTADATRRNEEHKAKMEELQKLMDATREALGKQVVAVQAMEFDTEAVGYLQASRWWMAGTIATVAVSLIVIWCIFLKDIHEPVRQVLATATQTSAMVSNPPAPLNTTQAPLQVGELAVDSKVITAAVLQQTIARILIVTLLYSAVVWCARNYFACRHNYAVNRHRRNALQTFRAFVEGTTDPATQDFILKQAAACAFSPQQSGYLKDESLPTPGPVSQVMESTRPDPK